MCHDPSRGVSAPADDPPRDRASPADFLASRHGHGARASSPRRARRARPWCLTPPKNNSDACVSRTIATWRSGATWVFAVAGHRGGEERARQATCVGIDVPRCASRSGRAARRAVRAERTTRRASLAASHISPRAKLRQLRTFSRLITNKRYPPRPITTCQLWTFLSAFLFVIFEGVTRHTEKEQASTEVDGSPSTAEGRPVEKRKSARERSTWAEYRTRHS